METGVPHLRVFQKLATSPDLNLAAVVQAINAIAFTPEELATLASPDPAHPYGRRVLLTTDMLEVMVATWTDGIPCVPHDHGGAVGAVRILCGEAQHRIWALDNGNLTTTHTHTATPGEVLSCGPNMIHSMCATDGPMMTLHLYTRAIDHMVIYGLEHPETLVVHGGCGAWIPEDTAMIHRRRAGHHSRATMTDGLTFS